MPDTGHNQAETRQAMTGAPQEVRQATTGAAVLLPTDQVTVPAAVPAAVQATAEAVPEEDIAAAVQAGAEALPAAEDKGRI